MKRLLPFLFLFVTASLLSACPGPRAASGPTVADDDPVRDGGGEAPDEATPPAAAPARAEKIITLDGLTEYRLPNGLRVVLFPDATKATLTVNVTYFVGSRHEGYGETGMAHLLEHMVFKGTPTHDDIWGLFERRGADFNGSTWTDRTNYYETVPSTAENLELLLTVEADRMVNSAISAEDLATEFTVVRNEFESGENDPGSILEERMMQTAFLWHNYGKPTIGARSDIERVPADALRAFYQTYYQPDNAMLLVAGQFDEASALSIIERSFGAIPRPARTIPVPYTVEPAQDGERTVTLRRSGDVSLVGVLYHGVPGAHPDFAAVEALGDILTDEPSGRLYKALVETGLAASVGASTYQWKDPGVMTFVAEVRDEDDRQEVEDTMVRIIEEAAKQGVTRDEVTRFRNRTLKYVDLAMTDSEGIAIELSEWAALGDWRLMMVHRQRIADLTAADVSRVARERLTASNRTIGRFIPTAKAERAPVVETPDAAEVVAAYAGGATIEPGEAFEATIANIEARTSRVELAGGIKAALLAKKTRGATVHLRLQMHHGDVDSLRGKGTAAQLLGAIVQRGTAKRTYQELEDELDRLRSDIDISSSDGLVVIDVVTWRDNLEAAVALAAEMARTPRFDRKELEIVREEVLSSLEQQRQDPDTVGFTDLLVALSPYPDGDPRDVATIEERIARMKKVTLAELKRYHADFWGADHAEVVVLGDFDPDATRALIEKHFSGWKAKLPYTRMPELHQAMPAAERRTDTPDKEDAIVLAGVNLDARDDDADYPALEMAGYILGGALQSRLFQRLRQKEGLSYGAFGYASASPLDRSGRAVVGANCAPQNAARAVVAMKEETERFASAGVTAEELAVFKTSWIEAFTGSVASDEWVASSLLSGLELGRTLDHEQQLRDHIAALTPEDILAVARKHLTWTDMVQVTAGDAAKMK